MQNGPFQNIICKMILLYMCMYVHQFVKVELILITVWTAG